MHVKNIHPVHGAGIRTHDLCNMSLLPQPLDQGCSVECLTFLNKSFVTIFAKDDNFSPLSFPYTSESRILTKKVFYL